MNRALTAAAALAAALALAACGGDGDEGGEGAVEFPGGADPEAARVIDEWSTALREGDVEAAADYFALPSIAQNGTPVLDLSEREDVVAFNEALPCGAELLEASEEDRYVIATFELTDRPGGDCGEGVGNTARTAFVIEDGKITEWLRAPNGTPLPPADTPVV
jgi:hypothetical protein